MKSNKEYRLPFGSITRTLSVMLTLAGLVVGTLWAASLDRTEVTNRQYAEFILTTGKSPPEHWPGTNVPKDMADEPITLINWHDAKAYCEWKGMQLPSQQEWRDACRSEGFQKIGDVWEWTRSEDERGWKILCGPMGTCDCSHRYKPEWKNAVKGFRCVGDTPVAMLPGE